MSPVPRAILAASACLCGAQAFVAPAAPPAAAGGSSADAADFRIASAPGLAAEQPSQASWSPLAFGAALGLLAAVVGGRPALAADLENGETVFQGNCAACHAGGNNSIVPEKKIKKAELEKYLTGGYKVEAIQYQVTNGKNSMPAFGDKLGPDDIEDVATYVYNQADKW
uniref:Cytochrome c-553 n=1 Tax=Zooxanthella nutricula TaxID=1333877 RepID=A0A7S2QHM3_9DINO